MIYSRWFIRQSTTKIFQKKFWQKLQCLETWRSLFCFLTGKICQILPEILSISLAESVRFCWSRTLMQLHFGNAAVPGIYQPIAAFNKCGGYISRTNSPANHTYRNFFPSIIEVIHWRKIYLLLVLI